MAKFDGRDYHFVTHEQFDHMRQVGEFLEWKEVFGRGDWYGTPVAQTEQGLKAGHWMLLEIDVQGALSIRTSGLTVSFFVHPCLLKEWPSACGVAAPTTNWQSSDDWKSLRRNYKH
ncbi:MAG: hypothetical protein R3C56_29045 [Pirellulaceae bacterium]